MRSPSTHVFAIAALALSPLAIPHQQPTSLRVVDTGGTEVVVNRAVVDYGGMFSADREAEGLRVRQGEGTVLIRWSTVDSLKIAKVDSATRPPTVHLEVVLRNGTRRTATLLQKGRMQLLGTTDLGDYTVDIPKLRVIVPVR